MEYIILLLSLTLLSLIFKIFGINIKNNKQYLLIIVIILTLFLGLRGPKVGLDMINYYKFFVIESQVDKSAGNPVDKWERMERNENVHGREVSG